MFQTKVVWIEGGT